jgi:hypothetical protein
MYYRLGDLVPMDLPRRTTWESLSSITNVRDALATLGGVRIVRFQLPWEDQNSFGIKEGNNRLAYLLGLVGNEGYGVNLGAASEMINEHLNQDYCNDIGVVQSHGIATLTDFLATALAGRFVVEVPG